LQTEEELASTERPEGKPPSRTEGDEMSDQEQKTFDEGEEQPKTEEAIRDLEPSEEEAEDVKGGIQDSEDRWQR
jgi:hypothetical protein